ncbi:MAG: YbaK/EbsC family protein [Patescibacteria group bacterium]
MLSPNAQKIQDALENLDFSYEVVELAQPTHTAAEAAKAVGCQEGQIAKSLVFKTKKTEQPILVIASGINRVDEQKIGKLTSEPIEKADANFVRRNTGFVIGGIPPIGHSQKLKTFIDKDLLQYREIWAAAGTPNAVFKLSPADLVKMTDGQVVGIKN